MPVALNCLLVVGAMLGLPGVTEIETRTALVTVSVVEPLVLPTVAVISEVQCPAPSRDPFH